jgi:hypothetical protein
MICLGAILLLSYSFIVITILTKDLNTRKSIFDSIPSLRAPYNLTRVYRTTELLHKYSMLYVGPVILPLQTLLSQLILTCNYMLIAKSDIVSTVIKYILIYWSLFGMLAWLTFLSLAANVNTYGKSTIKSWKFLKVENKTERKYISKFAKSCKPMCWGKQGFILIRKKTVLKFIQGIVRGTFRAVIALKR